MRRQTLWTTQFCEWDKVTDTFVYLGSTLTRASGFHAEMYFRIEKGSVVLGNLEKYGRIEIFL